MYEKKIRGGATADDEEETDDEVAAAAFIDDREVEDDDVAMYREVDNDEVVDRNQVIVTEKEEELNLDDYKIPEDETVDLLSGEDSDHTDMEPREKTWEEACDILGVTLAPDTAAVMNAAIDKVMIASHGKEGTCTYRAILNGIFAKKNPERPSVVTEERFATCLPNIYRVVSAYKEALQYVTVGGLVDILDSVERSIGKVGLRH